MKYLRNPEIKREIAVFTVLWGLCMLIGGWKEGLSGVIWTVVPGALFVSAHFLFSYQRYRKIAMLSGEVNRFLHGYETIRIGEQQEGELAVLESEIAKMTLRLKNQTELLRKDKEYLADSIADISHQIRTPLTAMNLIVSRLSTQDMTAEKRKRLTKELESLLVHIDWLIQSLLKISKLDAGTIQMQRVKVPVQELIRHATDTLEIPMELRGQILTVDCHPDVCFNGDMKWMKEALMNIVKNCMEHTPEGGTVWIRAVENALYTEIVVQDNGPGIEKEDLPHLFERFYKGKNSSEKSVGIGLALARMIIHEQQGMVSAENVLRKDGEIGGARFVIRFYKSTV